jgi:parvulin-like peptidyl-prolyl isomerase
MHSEQVVDFIVAKVGREIILFSDLAKQINQMRGARMWHDDMTPELVLADMVENKLIVQKAREQNIRIDERRIKATAENQINHIRSQFPSVRDFHRELRASGLVLSDLRKYYEDMLTEQFLRERLIQTEIKNKINLTDSELFEYFTENLNEINIRPETYELAMILRIPSASVETQRAARAKINEIRNRIQRGEDFVRLARSMSECPSSNVGGDLGYFTRGMMVMEFEEVAFRTGVNEISDIVRTEFGFHIIMVTDRSDDEIRASHILVRIEETQEDIDREKQFITELQKMIVAGENFANLASEHSHDADSQARGGVLGQLTKDEFPHWFRDELSNLTVGEITPVLDYQNMFYIFTINTAFEPRAMSFEESKDDIRDRMFLARQFELYENWIESLKREIYVQIFDESLEMQN